MKSFSRHRYSRRAPFLGQPTAKNNKYRQLKGNHGLAAALAYAKVQRSQPRMGEMEREHGGCKELWVILCPGQDASLKERKEEEEQQGRTVLDPQLHLGAPHPTWCGL